MLKLTVFAIVRPQQHEPSVGGITFCVLFATAYVGPTCETERSSLTLFHFIVVFRSLAAIWDLAQPISSRCEDLKSNKRLLLKRGSGLLHSRCLDVDAADCERHFNSWDK